MSDQRNTAITILEAVARMLAAAEADPRVVKDIRAIITREKRALSLAPLNTKKDASEKWRDEVSFAGAALGDIEGLLSIDMDRRTMERILVDRFNYSDRSVKSIGSKEKLLSSIRMSIKNESAHQTISKLTKG